MHDDHSRNHVHHDSHSHNHEPENGHHHHEHSPEMGHNHSHGDHLHSHTHGDSAHEKADELKVLATAFVEGFRSAKDKTSYLRLARIPFQRGGSDGLTMHLVDTNIVGNWQIGTASPAFASRELIYLPYPGEMVKSRETMTFTYVSLTERLDVDLVSILKTDTEI